MGYLNSGTVPKSGYFWQNQISRTIWYRPNTLLDTFLYHRISTQIATFGHGPNVCLDVLDRTKCLLINKKHSASKYLSQNSKQAPSFFKIHSFYMYSPLWLYSWFLCEVIVIPLGELVRLCIKDFEGYIPFCLTLSSDFIFLIL